MRPYVHTAFPPKTESTAYRRHRSLPKQKATKMWTMVHEDRIPIDAVASLTLWFVRSWRAMNDCGAGLSVSRVLGFVFLGRYSFEDTTKVWSRGRVFVVEVVLCLITFWSSKIRYGRSKIDFAKKCFVVVVDIFFYKCCDPIFWAWHSHETDGVRNWVGLTMWGCFPAQEGAMATPSFPHSLERKIKINWQWRAPSFGTAELDARCWSSFF